MRDVYDIVIIGGGPSGLTAGIYACRSRMKALVVERMACGGQVLIADTIENFPGFPDGIKGAELAEWMSKQAEHFGLKTETAEAEGIVMKKSEKEPFTVKLSDDRELPALSLIVSTGAKWNCLNVPGEKELTGRGVSYCATCDGPLFKGKDVVVVGGGDTALEDAIFLTKFAASVTIVHRRDRLRATRILQERASANKKINFVLNSVVTQIAGDKKVGAVKVRDVTSAGERELKADGVFVLIGITPNSEVVKGVVGLDEKGYVICDDDMRTSVDGIFACGDVRKKLLRQVVTACGDGATAAFSAEKYVERVKGVEYK